MLWLNWLTFAGWSGTGGAGGPGPGGPRSWALDCGPEMGVARIGFRAHLQPPHSPQPPLFSVRQIDGNYYKQGLCYFLESCNVNTCTWKRNIVPIVFRTPPPLPRPWHPSPILELPSHYIYFNIISLTMHVLCCKYVGSFVTSCELSSE